jgi:hypothetical protein
MDGYGSALPLTGAAGLTIGGVTAGVPVWIAAVGMVVVVGGFLLHRLARPAKVKTRA